MSDGTVGDGEELQTKGVVASPPLNDLLSCSFCNANQDSVGLLIAGTKAFICNECVVNAVNIISKHLSEKIKQLNMK